MTVDVLSEPDIPEIVLQLLATPVSRSQQAWYVGAKGGVPGALKWLIATLWNEPSGAGCAHARWGISLRGEADAGLSDKLIGVAGALAAQAGDVDLVTDAIVLDAPFDRLLQRAGFVPLECYRTVLASTYATLRGVGLGVAGAPLQAAGWAVGSPRDDELRLLVTMFLHELGQIPPQLMHLIEQPSLARSMDQTLVLRRENQVVAALVARRIDRTMDIQGLVCHRRWRQHRAFSWLLAERAATWPLIADSVVFSFPESNAGMADIARRIDAQVMARRHALILKARQ